jgi:hypothetical protein
LYSSKHEIYLQEWHIGYGQTVRDCNTFYTFEARGYTDYLLYAERAPAIAGSCCGKSVRSGDATRADELMMATQLYRLEDRMRSIELVSKIFKIAICRVRVNQNVYHRSVQELVSIDTASENIHLKRRRIDARLDGVKKERKQ